MVFLIKIAIGRKSVLTTLESINICTGRNC